MHMKKISLILSFAVLIAMSASGTAYAAYVEGSKTFGSTTTVVYKTSKNVWMDYSAYSTAPATAYTMVTSHSSGDRTIGSGSFDQKVYYFDVTKQTLPSCDTDTASKFENTAGWSAL